MTRPATPHDQADWDVCISWQRMSVACQSHDRGLSIPVTLFLHETRLLVERCEPRVSNRAHTELREAWKALAEKNEWMACVLGCKTRAIVALDETADRKAAEGQTLCILIRETYPKAPPRFEKAGRLASNK